jgi:hypothetical protein
MMKKRFYLGLQGVQIDGKGNVDQRNRGIKLFLNYWL